MAGTDPIYLDILKDKFKTTKKNAKTLLNQGQTQRAASEYEQCADLANQIADEESNSDIADSWGDIADSMSAAATKIQQDGYLEPPEPDQPSNPDSNKSQNKTTHQNGDDAPTADEFDTEKPDIDFSDVGGMAELKQELLDKIRDPIERRDLYQTYDIGVANAILLYGPPGTGKTYITKALAGELDFNYIDVNADDIVSKYVGEAAENVARLFEVAVEKQPTLIFLDEIDAISQQRAGGDQQTQSQAQMVNQLLTEISDIKNDEVVVISATNRPDIIDDALLDRFEELIEVPLPDPQARIAMFRVHLRDRPILSEGIDWGRIKELTEGFSARDIETSADNAALEALTEARETGSIQPITQEHLVMAINDTNPIESEYGEF